MRARGSTPEGAQEALARSLYSMLAALTLIWGFNWTVLKVVITEVPPWFFRSLCFLSAFCGLLVIAWARRLAIRVPRGQWGMITLIAFFTVSLQNFFMMLALPLLPSGRVVILHYTMPVWSVLLSRVILGEALTVRRLAGVLLMFGSAFARAIGTVPQRRLPVDLPIASFTGWMGLIGGIPIFVLVFVFERDRLLALHGVSLWPALGVLYNMILVFIFGW